MNLYFLFKKLYKDGDAFFGPAFGPYDAGAAEIAIRRCMQEFVNVFGKCSEHPVAKILTFDPKAHVKGNGDPSIVMDFHDGQIIEIYAWPLNDPSTLHGPGTGFF